MIHAGDRKVMLRLNASLTAGLVLFVVLKRCIGRERPCATEQHDCDSRGGATVRYLKEDTVTFYLADYPPEVARVLGADGGAIRPMPLVAKNCTSEDARATLNRWKALELFPKARSPQGVLAGLYLYFSCEAEAHAIAQDLNTTEGSFWHGILHRQEPDAFNSGYWFRRVGKHAIFPALRREAGHLGYDVGAEWDPLAFIDYCEAARTRPGSKEEGLAMQVQLVEWQLLFDYCIREKTR